MTDQYEPTRAQHWTERARQTIEQGDRPAFEAMLTPDFVQESRRIDRFGLDREELLDLYDTMKELDFHIAGADVAVAGDLHVLTCRVFATPNTRTELLAISEWTDDGRLARLIEFDPDDRGPALAELERITGVPPVILID